ncbi:MAG: hypothetical protein M1832_001331 [Thelocarpon impressellum]|nr:MAG: hypothetical protein M1832_001331 [Thelocarpon impressellum]
MPSAVAPAQPSQPYIPKLAFRNASSFEPPGPPSELTRTVSVSPSARTAASTPLSAPQTVASSNTSFTSLSHSYFSLPSPRSSTTTVTTTTTTTTGAAAATFPKPPVKKKSSLLGGFFSVKEPSTQAFQEFKREQARKAAAASAQTGRSSAALIPGVSSTKLPSSVPRVNTKWDGVPKSMKDRDQAKDRPVSVGPPAALPGMPASHFQGSTSTVGSRGSRGYVVTPTSTDGSRSDMGSSASGSTPFRYCGGVAHSWAEPATSTAAPLRSPSQTSLPDFLTDSPAGLDGIAPDSRPAAATLPRPPVLSRSHRPPSATRSTHAPTPAPPPAPPAVPLATWTDPPPPPSPAPAPPSTTTSVATSERPPVAIDDAGSGRPVFGSVGPPTPTDVPLGSSPFPAGEAAPMRTPPDEPRREEPTKATWRRSMRMLRPERSSEIAERPQSRGRRASLTRPLSSEHPRRDALPRPPSPAEPAKSDKSESAASLKAPTAPRVRSGRDRSVTPWDFCEIPEGPVPPVPPVPTTAVASLAPPVTIASPPPEMPAEGRLRLRRSKIFSFGK